MGLPVTGEVSVAADPKFIPMGAPIFLSMDRAEPNGIWIAQDTGGAIKGPNRVDTFWGAGTEALAIPGGMSARGDAWLLVPTGTYARLMQAKGTPSYKHRGAGGPATPPSGPQSDPWNAAAHTCSQHIANTNTARTPEE